MPDSEFVIEPGADKRLFRFLSKLNSPVLSESDAVAALLKRTELMGVADIGPEIARLLLRAQPGTTEELLALPDVGPKRMLALLRAFSAEHIDALATDVQGDALEWLRIGIESPRLTSLLSRYGDNLPRKLRAAAESQMGLPADLTSFVEITGADAIHDVLDLAVLAPSDPTPETDEAWEGTISPATEMSFYSAAGRVASAEEIARLRRELSAVSDTGLAKLAEIDEERAGTLRESIGAALDALDAWNHATSAMESGMGISAARWYGDATSGIRRYLELRFGSSDPTELLNDSHGVSQPAAAARAELIAHFRDRSEAATIERLHEIDWVRPRAESAPYGSLQTLAHAFGTNDPILVRSLDAPLTTMLYAHVPLGVAEAVSYRSTARSELDADCCCCCCVEHEHENDQYDHARPCCDHRDLHRPGQARPFVLGHPLNVGSAVVPNAAGVLDGLLQLHSTRPILSPVEELSALVMRARLLLDEADGFYKAGDRPQAESAYRGVIELFRRYDTAEYVGSVEDALDGLQADRIALLTRSYDALPPFAGSTPPALPPVASDLDQHRFDSLGWALALRNVRFRPLTLAHAAPLVRFALPGGGLPLASNPSVFAMILEAHARLVQIRNGLNWLGYRDDYLPPWRFQYLLDRARYFANHARQVQSTFMNFLASAEREDLQERSAANAVALEAANVATDTKRLELSRLELRNAHQNAQAQEQFASHASQRASGFGSFSGHMSQLVAQSTNWAMAGTMGVSRSFFTPTSSGLMGVMPGFRLTQAGVAALNAINQQILAQQQQSAQRAQEAENLRLAAQQAATTALLGRGQVAVAGAALDVAALQRAAGLMRHRFAVETLSFLRTRTLSARVWHRLADEMRRVTATYLHRAMELAFLAEQAYEFETNRRANVIRFDYDTTETGELLGADLLVRDLDSLEHEFVTNETVKRQSVRYVVSMARDFPDELRILREHGACAFGPTLLPIERRFPGLYNLRIAAIDVQPVALMDPTRFSVSLTHLGSSAIRVRPDAVSPSAGIGTPPLFTRDVRSWCPDPQVDREWPVKVRYAKVESHVFSGLSAHTETNDEAFFRTSQRSPFEGIGAAATWSIDLSMPENRIDPRTIADVVITFRLTGYFSERLKRSIVASLASLPPGQNVETLSLSARGGFPDGYYGFQNGGRMVWDVDTSWIPQGLRAGRLRNLGVQLIPSRRAPEFGRTMSRHRVRARMTPQGTLEILSPIPRLAVRVTRLDVVTEVTFDGLVDPVGVRWRFEDQGEWVTSSPPAPGAPYRAAHSYRRPGRYTLTLRAQRDGRLYEYRASVSVSSTVDVDPPLLAWPRFDVVAPADPARIKVSAGGAAGGSVHVHAVSDPNGHGALTTAGPDEVELKAGVDYTLHVLIARELKVRFTSFQIRTDDLLPVAKLYGASNLEYRADGTLSGLQPNTWGAKLLATGAPAQPRVALSPLDQWELTVEPDDNTFLKAVDAAGRPITDLTDIEDVILTMEYETEQN